MKILKKEIDDLTKEETLEVLKSISDDTTFYSSAIDGVYGENLKNIKLEYDNEYHIKIMIVWDRKNQEWVWTNSIEKRVNWRRWDNFQVCWNNLQRMKKLKRILQ